MPALPPIADMGQTGSTVGRQQGERTQIANYAQNKMVGLTKEQALACMRSPASKATEGATEV
jgi:hypothetical protein